MRYLIGIDLGTSGVKAAIFDEKGFCVSSSTVEYPLYQPQNGWAEQKPDEWWEAVASALRGIMGKSGAQPQDVAGIGLSGQMHGLVMLDEAGRPLRDSILWCDGRTARECAEITEAIGAKRLIEITANPALAGFTAGKILWVRRHEPDVYSACRHILLPKDYIRYKLCGVFATEVSDASGMNLLDVPKRDWSDEVLEKLGIDAEWLPKMHESCEITGYVTPEAAALTGLAPGIPVVGGAGDNAAAAVGTGVVESGKAFTTIGTSGVIFAHADEVAIDPAGRVHTFCSAVPGAWTVMSCTLAAGGSLKWLRDNFYGAEMKAAAEMDADPYTLMTKQAELSPIGSNRLIFLPYLMGERSPILDPDARGVFFGLSGMHMRRDMLRAVMEGVVYSLRECLDVFKEMGVGFREMLATGGGSRSVFWRRMMADVYNCPVVTLKNEEGPALGAAILAGVGTGVYESLPKACAALIETEGRLEPDPVSGAAYEPYYVLYKDVYSSLREQFKKLSRL
ncbi:MAG: xylulokinase [Clostridiales Family XIII bacterium]|jgi:xylulokinase|nr:xylulokinase [Clostridiales Family XIII bacterium]